jgi:predicted RND superfamily exporter protein
VNPIDIASRVVAWVDRLRWPVLIALLPLLVLAALAARGVGVDNAVDVWFVEGDPALTAYHGFQDRFGNDEVVAMAIHDPAGVLTVEGLARIDRVARAAAAVDGIAEVTAVTDLVHARTDEDWRPDPSVDEAPPLVVGPVLDALPTTPAEAERARRRILEDPLVREALLSEDGTTALVVARMEAGGDLDAVRDRVLAELDLAVAAADAGHVPRAGVGVVFSALNVASSRDVAVVGTVSYAIIAVLLGLLFRRVAAVALTFGIVGAAVVLTFGLYGAAGRDLNMVTMAMPTLLLIIGVADAVHMLHRIADQPAGDRAERVRRGVAEVLWPCLFTSLTTAAGFAALGTARMQVVRDLGLFAAAGVLAAFALSVVMVLIGARWAAVEPRARSMDWLARAVAGAGAWATANAMSVLGGAALLTLAGAWGLSQLRVDTYSIDYFYAGHPVRTDSAFIESHFGPYTPLELVVRGEDLRNVEDLRAIAAWQDRMEADPGVGWTRSIADLTRRLNQVLSDGRPESFVVPADDLRLEQALFLFESDPDADLDDLIDADWTEARVTVGIPMLSARGFGATIERLTAAAALPPHLEIVPTGYLPLYVTMMDYVVSSQIASFAMAFVVIFGLLAALFRSARMALLAMPANLLPLFLTLGVMGVAGIRLDVATVTIAALVLGLVVDDTTHFLFRFREQLHAGLTHEQAVQQTLSTTGVAMTTTTVVLVLGFTVLGLATVKSVAYFGVLSAIALSTALVADVLLMPALLVVLRPRL